MNVGELNVTLKLDKAPYEKGLTQAEATGNKSRARLSKAVTVKVNTTDLKAMNAQVDALTKRGSQLRHALVNAIPRSSQARELNRQLREVETRIRNISKVSQEAKGSSLFGKLGRLAGGASKLLGPLGLALGAGAVASGVVNLGKNMIQLARDAQESENLFKVSMGEMEAEARRWSNSVGRSLGLNRYELRKMVGTYNVMLKSMGLSEDQAYSMSTSLSKLSHDMASFYNLQPGEAFEKLQAGITGEAEPLKRLGILINEGAVSSYALANGLLDGTRRLDEQTKVLARYGLIMQQTRDAQGDLARTADSPVNMERKLKARWEERQISLGNKLLPAYKAMLVLLGEILTAVERIARGMKGWLLIVAEVMKWFGKAMNNPGVSSIGQLVEVAIRALESAQMRSDIAAMINRTVSDGAAASAMAVRRSSDEEIDALQDVIEKRRQMTEERRKQLREAMGWASGGIAIWERGMAASVRRAVSTTQDNRLTPGNLPTTREIVQMSKDMARMQADTEVIRDHIREALRYA